jgi:hypothetical protein
MAFGAQGRRRALAQLIADVGQHHLRALAQEQMRRRAAEAINSPLIAAAAPVSSATLPRSRILSSHFTVDRREDAPFRILPPSPHRGPA